MIHCGSCAAARIGVNDGVAVAYDFRLVVDGHIYGKIANGVREYELAADCLVVNINTEDNEGIEGDAKSAARAARYDYKTNQYVKNVVYVLDTDDKIIFMLIDGKNNAIDDITKY